VPFLAISFVDFILQVSLLELYFKSESKFIVLLDSSIPRQLTYLIHCFERRQNDVDTAKNPHINYSYWF